MQDQNDDLFQYQTPANDAGANAAVTQDIPANNIKPAEDETKIRTPLLFSDRAPIPTRDGEVEQGPGSNRKRVIKEQEKTFTPLSEAEIPPGSTLGQTLVLARQKSGYSLEQICSITRISQQYIDALEGDHFEDLPQGIFGPAYIRTLSKSYHLPDSIVQAMLNAYAEHAAQREEVSSEILKNLNSTGPINEAEERRLTYIFYGIVVTVAAVIIVGLWALTSVLIDVFSTPEQNQETATAQQPEVQQEIVFDQEQFRKLIPAPIEGKHVLAPDAKPQIRNR